VLPSAARIDGFVVSSAPVFLAFLAVHVTAGLTCVVSGGLAALSPKGQRRHVMAGKIYFWGICVLFTSATGLAIMRWREDYGFFLIGLVAFCFALTGFLARERHWPGDTAHIVGMGGSYSAMLTAFYVDNGKHLPLWDKLPTAAFWVLPSAIGIPIIWLALRKYSHASPADRSASPSGSGSG
jgi:uncharacterized membrane protein